MYGRALLQDGQTDAAEHALQLATERFPIQPTALLFYATAAEHRRPFRIVYWLRPKPSACLPL